MKCKLKHAIHLFLTIAFVMTPTCIAFTQTPAEVVEIISVTDNDGITEILIASNQPFIIGSNRYVLYIGDEHYLRNTHPDGDESNILFYIPTANYQSHSTDDEIFLAYGLYPLSSDGQNTYVRTDAPNYALGKLKK